MKKSSALLMILPVISLFFAHCFAFSAYAKNVETAKSISSITQTMAKKAQNDSLPVQVNVNINNSAEASGNTQTTTINNSQTVTSSVDSAQSVPVQSSYAVENTKRLSGNNTLYGEYFSSPYQSKLQTEMLRHTVWGSLVPRKKIYRDPALGTYPLRYSVAKQSSRIEAVDSKTVDKASNMSTVDKSSNMTKANIGIEQNTSSFYEPLNKTEKPASSVNSKSGMNSVQRKVEGIQDALLIPKL